MVRLEGEGWTLSWSPRHLTCFPCPHCKVGNRQTHLLCIWQCFFLLTSNSLEQKQQRNLPLASWKSCWIKLFLKTETQVYLDSKSWREYFKTKWHLPFSQSQCTSQRCFVFHSKRGKQTPRGWLLWKFKQLKWILHPVKQPAHFHVNEDYLLT